MSDILVSYRQRDSSGWAGRIYDRLADHFGPERVHSDPGDAHSEIGAVVVVIGPEWLTAADPDTDLLVTDPGDEGAAELATAMRSADAVFPVLVDGAAMPAAHLLPPGLAQLGTEPPAVVGSLRFEDDVARLISSIDGAMASEAHLPAVQSAASRRVAIIVAILVLLAGAVLALGLGLVAESETGSAPVEFLLRT